MDKVIEFQGRTDRGIFTYVIDTESTHLVKTACDYHPEISSYINNAKKIPGKTQVLLTALGAGEWWGDNSNGDYFPEASLASPGQEYGYKTFLNAHAFKHHVNKDPAAAYGDVVVSVYNPTFHRVELVIVLDNAKAGDIVDKINNGEYPSWSMGCKVPYDVCSICGNKARTRGEYCEHLRYYMGRLDPQTGKKVYALNLQPKFFDISYVFIGADKIARTLKKVASVYGQKTAEIKKEVPVDQPPASQNNLEDDIRSVKENDPDMPRELLDRVSSRYPLKDILSTLAMSRIVPRPHEFQRIVLVSLGHKPVADHWEERGLTFDPDESSPPISRISIGPENFNDDMFNMISPMVPHRSFYPGPFMKRVTILVKRANNKRWEKLANENQVEEKGGISPTKQVAIASLILGLWNHFARKAKDSSALPKFLLDHPALTTAVGAGIMLSPIFFGKSVMPSMKGNYVHMEPDRQNFIERQKPFTKISNKALTGLGMVLGSMPAAHYTSELLTKKRMTDPEYKEGPVKSFFRRYPELTALAGSAAGIRLLTGGKIMNKAYDLAAGLGSHIEKAIPHIKHADGLGEFALDTLVWPLAMGGPHLAHRLVGSAVDQLAFEGLKRLSKKPAKDKLN